MRFPNGGTLQVAKRLLNYAYTDLHRGSVQRLEEEAGRDDTWEVSPPNLVLEPRTNGSLDCRARDCLTEVLGSRSEKIGEK